MFPPRATLPFPRPRPRLLPLPTPGLSPLARARLARLGIVLPRRGGPPAA